MPWTGGRPSDCPRLHDNPTSPTDKSPMLAFLTRILFLDAGKSSLRGSAASRSEIVPFHVVPPDWEQTSDSRQPPGLADPGGNAVKILILVAVPVTIACHVLLFKQTARNQLEFSSVCPSAWLRRLISSLCCQATANVELPQSTQPGRPGTQTSPRRWQ